MDMAPGFPVAKKLAIHFGRDALRRVKTMLERQNLTGLRASVRKIPGGAIGCLGAELPAEGNVAFFTGLPINGSRVQGIATEDPNSAARRRSGGERVTPESFLRGGQQRPSYLDADAATRLFAQYDGAFVGIFWDCERRVLIITDDCLGMQPLYIREAGGELTLVSETKAVHGEPDLAAWGAFLSIGHPIGERSLVDGLTHAPPASIFTWACATRKLDIRRYWEWPEPSDAWRDFDFLDSLERDMRAGAAYGSPGTLLLSGGFDSRLLLFLLQRAGLSADALIVTHTGEHADADGRLARAVAARAKVRWTNAEPPTDFFSAPAYLDYLTASDAGFPSLDLFIAKVASHIKSSAVWDGLVPGFVFMPLHQLEGGFDTYLKAEIRGPDSAVWCAARTLFKPDVAEAMYAGFRDDLKAEVARVGRDAHGLNRFVIENRSRNRPAMNPLKVYANWTRAFVPGLSKDFMSHAATIPFEEKRYARFYRRLLAQLDKRALEVPLLSGGELMPGSRAGVAYWRERARSEYATFRARHPSLFRHRPPSAAERSTFLDERLFADDDPWLDARARGRLQSTGADAYTTWKLLFHWKAWRWVHEGRLAQSLGYAESRDPYGEPDVRRHARSRTDTRNPSPLHANT